MTTIIDATTLNGILSPEQAAGYWHHHYLAEQTVAFATQSHLNLLQQRNRLLEDVLRAYLELQQFLNFRNVIPEEQREAREATLQEQLKEAVVKATHRV